MLVVALRLVVGFLALAFGPQVVLAKLSLRFATVEQCAPISINFTGKGDPLIFPLTLTVLPFDSVPISIPVPASSWDGVTSTGAYVSFLPFAAGTTFLATLDNSSGTAVSLVSDVIKVMPSSNSSCVANFISDTKTYNINDDVLSQCQNFSVAYDESIAVRAPSIRAFVPRLFSFPVNMTQNDTDLAPGVATYVTDLLRGSQAIFMFDDGQNHRETTSLMTISGDSSSPVNCFHPITSNKVTSTKPSTSRTAIIAISTAGAGIVAIIAALLAFYILRERRRRRRETQRIEEEDNEKGDFIQYPNTPMFVFPPQGSRLIAKPPSSPASQIVNYYNDGDNGPYRGSWVSVGNSPRTASSEAWVHLPLSRAPSISKTYVPPTPVPVIAPPPRSMSRFEPPARRASEYDMTSPLDINRILNTAMIYNTTDPLRPSHQKSASSTQLAVPARPFLSRHDRDPSDVPQDHTESMLFSTPQQRELVEAITRQPNGSISSGSWTSEGLVSPRSPNAMKKLLFTPYEEGRIEEEEDPRSSGRLEQGAPRSVGATKKPLSAWKPRDKPPPSGLPESLVSSPIEPPQPVVTRDDRRRSSKDWLNGQGSIPGPGIERM